MSPYHFGKNGDIKEDDIDGAPTVLQQGFNT